MKLISVMIWVIIVLAIYLIAELWVFDMQLPKELSLFINGLLALLLIGLSVFEKKEYYGSNIGKWNIILRRSVWLLTAAIAAARLVWTLEPFTTAAIICIPVAIICAIVHASRTGILSGAQRGLPLIIAFLVSLPVLAAILAPHPIYGY